MPTVKQERIAKQAFEYYKTYREDSFAWRIQRDRNQKFYMGQQHSQTTGAKLQSRGQSDIVVNKVRALNRMRVSMMIANKPIGNVLGVNKSDVSAANKLNQFADWHLYNSDWQFHLERLVMGQNVVGIHYLTLFSDPLADYGRGELKIGNESYRHIFVDKSAGSSSWDFSDSPRIINSKQRRPEDFLNSMPKKIRDRLGLRLDDLHSIEMPDDEIRWDGESQHREADDIGTPATISNSSIIDPSGNVLKSSISWLRELDTYEKVIVDVPVLMNAQNIVVAVLDPDDPNLPKKEIDQKKQEIQARIKSEGLTEKIVPQRRIKYRKTIGDKIVVPLNGDDFRMEDILPIENYPIIPVIDEDTGNALPKGEIDFQYGIQEIYNACISLTLLNASLASNMKIIIDATALQDTDFSKFRDRWAIPGEVFNMRTNPQTGKFPIEVIRPEPLSQAWFLLAQSMAQEIESQISTFSLRTGDPTNAPDTFAATLQLGQWSQDILRIPLNRLELGLERLYNNIFQWSPTYYDFEKVFFTLGNDGAPGYEAINFNTMPFVKARYRIRAGSTLPSQTVAELGILQSLAQQNPALIGAVIDRMPNLTDETRDDIKKTIDIVAKLEQQNAQQEEIVNVLQTQLQHLNEQNASLMRKAAMAPFETEVKKNIDALKRTRKDLEKANGRQPKSRRS